LFQPAKRATERRAVIIGRLFLSRVLLEASILNVKAPIPSVKVTILSAKV
jgi:hypothetical protein